MLSTKTLAIVGASEETVAHFRLLMRMGQTKLLNHWRWGPETAADFVAVEVNDLGCEGVMARCQAAGVPCAVLAEADDVVVHGLVLRRPLKLDQIVAVLNAAATATADAGDIEAFSEDFYLRELEEVRIPARDVDDIWARQERPEALAAERPAGEPPAEGLDRHIHGDPLQEPEPPKPLIQPDTTVDARRGEQSRRSFARAEQSRHRVMPPGVVGVNHAEDTPVVIPPRQDGSIPGGSEGPRLEFLETTGRHLLDYLEGTLVSSPTQLTCGSLPALTLDPKERVFHSAAGLAELEAWFDQIVSEGTLRTVTMSELNRLRDEQPGRPYDELKWLDALLRSGGRLANQLDPGGSFQVSRPVDVDPDYHAHGPIAAALATSRRLHELSAESRASMMQVYDVVNAYDAIGRLSWTPRQRFAPSEIVSSDGKPVTRARSRLKWPFGKR